MSTLELVIYTYSIYFLYISALTVRFLTRRYIGEYDHQSGEKDYNADTSDLSICMTYRTYVCVC